MNIPQWVAHASIVMNFLFAVFAFFACKFTMWLVQQSSEQDVKIERLKEANDGLRLVNAALGKSEFLDDKTRDLVKLAASSTGPEAENAAMIACRRIRGRLQ
jgi:hypothetical protein